MAKIVLKNALSIISVGPVKSAPKSISVALTFSSKQVVTLHLRTKMDILDVVLELLSVAKEILLLQRSK